MLNLFAQIPTYSSSYDSTSNYDSGATTALASIFAAFSIIFFIMLIIVVVLFVVSRWKIFTKAGKPGWAAIIPIYNSIIHMEVIGRPGWWFLLYSVPLFGLYVSIIDSVLLTRSFGKDSGFAVGLIILPIIFYPMLGFGSASYRGPSANNTSLSI